jgi:uncharacterized protein YdeI (BOF family)
MRYLWIMLLTLALAAPAAYASAAETAGAPAAAAPHKTKAAKTKGVPKKAPVDTVAKALASGDKTPMRVTGQLVEKVPGKKVQYVFEDATGRVTVVLGKKALKGAAAPALQSEVRLAGVLRVKNKKNPVMVVHSVQPL